MFEGRHRLSIFDGRHINHRSSKVDTSISEGRLIDLRKSTHRDIDLRRATHRSSKVDASIFEDRRRKHHTYNSSSNMAHNYGVPFVSKLKMMLIFTIHAGIYGSCWYLRSMLVFTLHAGTVNTSTKCKYQHES